MNKNMGTIDRILRFVVAAVFVILYFMNVISGTFAIVLWVLSGVFILTSFVGFCPLYALFGMQTCAVKNK